MSSIQVMTALILALAVVTIGIGLLALKKRQANS